MAMRALQDALPPNVSARSEMPSASCDAPWTSGACASCDRLAAEIEELEQRIRKGEVRRRALIHIMGDLNAANRRLADQRKAMLHIMADYERDRRRVVRQTEHLHNSRRALMHILVDSHRTNQRLGSSRKAMIHIMGDLRETTIAIERREHELRTKQEQLVQAAKLATLGELTTGVAHELNNPLNNIGLFIGNAIDHIDLGRSDTSSVLHQLRSAMQQVRKATEIISHLRTFGRAAPATRERLNVMDVLRRAQTLMNEQLRLRQIEVEVSGPEAPMVDGNPIQLEQVFLNLLTNARDAMAESPRRRIEVSCRVDEDSVIVEFRDTGHGIPEGLERRVFDPFFTTKDVGQGTGLGLSITYGIIKEHEGAIWVARTPEREGATIVIQLPRAAEAAGGVS